MDEYEGGGGVMIVFSNNPKRAAEIAEAVEYTTQSFEARRLIVSKHEGIAGPKKPHPR